jgi:hypothetical protein
MPQLSLERPRIDAVIRQLKAAGVAQHVARNISADYAISATASMGAVASISARTELSDWTSTSIARHTVVANVDHPLAFNQNSRFR